MSKIGSYAYEGKMKIHREMAKMAADEMDECYFCGEPCGNPQGYHYECACIHGEDLDRTTGFGELAHVW